MNTFTLAGVCAARLNDPHMHQPGLDRTSRAPPLPRRSQAHKQSSTPSATTAKSDTTLPLQEIKHP
jgi:hypothetical protein